MVKYARKTKKTNRKKRAYGRKARGRSNYSVARTSPISDRTFTRLKYSMLTALNYGGLGFPTNHQFRINSLFDPDFSLGGHQPLGYDQYSTLYNKYRVHGMGYKITFINRETAYQLEVATQLRPNSVAQTNIDTIHEAPYTQKRIIGIEGGRSMATIKGYASMAKIRGVSKSVIKSDDQYSASTGANPAISAFLQIYMQNQTSNVAAECAIRVELEYFCEFYDRKLLLQS